MDDVTPTEPSLDDLTTDTVAVRAGRRHNGTDLAPVIHPTTTFVTPTVADPDGERIVRIEWSWGDGTANSTSPNLGYNGHQYLQDGAYTIRLMVTDAQVPLTVSLLFDPAMLSALPSAQSISAVVPTDP